MLLDCIWNIYQTEHKNMFTKYTVGVRVPVGIQKNNSKMCKLYNLHSSNPTFSVLYERKSEQAHTSQAPPLLDNE